MNKTYKIAAAALGIYFIFAVVAWLLNNSSTLWSAMQQIAPWVCLPLFLPGIILILMQRKQWGLGLLLGAVAITLMVLLPLLLSINFS